MDAPNLDVHINVFEGDVLQRVKEVVNTLKDWSVEDIEVKALDGGLLNKAWVCSGPSNSGSKVVVKVNTDKENRRAIYVNRKYELLAMKQLSNKGLIHQVIGSFSNGVVYSYSEGKVPSHSELHSSKIRRALMKKLHRIHTTMMPFKSDSPDVKDNIYLYHILHEFLPKLPDVLKIGNTQNSLKPTITNMFPWVMSFFDEFLNKYPIVFCHMDVWHGNVVYDNEKDEVSLLDWELCGHACAVFDLARCTQKQLGKDECESKTFEKDLVRDYLTTHPDDLIVTEDLVNQWHEDVLKARMVISVAQIIWGWWWSENIDMSDLMPFLHRAMEIVLTDMRETEAYLKASHSA